MVNPLPIFFYVFLAAVLAGCTSRSGNNANGGEHRDARQPGAPHHPATPVSALGIRG
ncbi:MAG TPA: hypothetical protein VEC06_11440 [Paucimonas sp.]|nr:hypothetical protein [Paucimonas sp.]